MKGMEYIHTEFPRLPAWLGPVPERVGKRQPVAAGNLRGVELKMAGETNTQMHRRIAVLRHSHSTTVPTLSLEHAQQVVRIPLHYRLRAKFKQALGDGMIEGLKLR